MKGPLISSAEIAELSRVSYFSFGQGLDLAILAAELAVKAAQDNLQFLKDVKSEKAGSAR